MNRQETHLSILMVYDYLNMGFAFDNSR